MDNAIVSKNIQPVNEKASLLIPTTLLSSFGSLFKGPHYYIPFELY